MLNALVSCLLIVFCSQVGGSAECSLPPTQRLTRSLLSGSGASYSGASESAGGSCGPSRYSRPYVLCSATDAASAAIDFSKGSVDDGVVDSPPSRGPVRTPICSPSPLKQATSTAVRSRSHSPNPRSKSTPHRKLYRGSADEYAIPRLEDGVALLTRPPIHEDVPSAASSGDRKRRAPLRNPTQAQFPRIEDNPHSPMSPQTGGSSGSGGPVSRRPILRGDCRLPDSRSTGTLYPNLRCVSRVKAPRPTTSLSNNTETPPRAFRHQSEDNCALKMGTPGPMPTQRGYPMPSRREDILRGMAKVKALEAAMKDSQLGHVFRAR